MSQSDVDRLTGGAPMSPTADAYLPSDLLDIEEPPSPSNGSLLDQAQVNQIFQQSHSGYGGVDTSPNSPSSSGSKPASRFASPRSSHHNIPTYPSLPDSIDNDSMVTNTVEGSFEDSVQHEGQILHSAPGGRIASLWGLANRRGKTSDSEPPLLGSLNSAQSRSFPRNPNSPPGGLDPIGTRRRSGSHSGLWASLRNGGPPSAASVGNAPAPARGLKRGYNIFGSIGSKQDSVQHNLPPSSYLEPDSPRPGSTTSMEHPLPRPSSDYPHFGWAPAGNNSGSNRSSLIEGTDWSAFQPSRRSTHSSISIPHPLAYSSAPTLQPIGTRAIGSRPATPKLNPAAQPFRLLARFEPSQRSEENEKDVDEAGPSSSSGRFTSKLFSKKESKKSMEKFPDTTIEAGPSSDNRSSKASIYTEESSLAESHESLERSVSTTSNPADPAQSVTSKESFMSRITRKGSSSKFNMANWKDKGKMFSKKVPGGSETDDESGDGGLSRSLETPSVTSSPNLNAAGSRSSFGTSFGGFMGRGKGKGKQKEAEIERTSFDERSETGDDNDEEYDGMQN
jgi:hypothetical protein